MRVLQNRSFYSKKPSGSSTEVNVSGLLGHSAWFPSVPGEKKTQHRGCKRLTSVTFTDTRVSGGRVNTKKTKKRQLMCSCGILLASVWLICVCCDAHLQAGSPFSVHNRPSRPSPARPVTPPPPAFFMLSLFSLCIVWCGLEDGKGEVAGNS